MTDRLTKSDWISHGLRTLAKAGAKITRPPGPMKHGTTVIAFIEDPDGHKIELIERK